MAAGVQPLSGWGEGIESGGGNGSRAETASGSAFAGRGGSTESMDTPVSGFRDC